MSSIYLSSIPISRAVREKVYGKRDERNEGIVRILTILIAGVCCVGLQNPPGNPRTTRPNPAIGLGWDT